IHPFLSTPGVDVAQPAPCFRFPESISVRRAMFSTPGVDSRRDDLFGSTSGVDLRLSAPFRSTPRMIGAGRFPSSALALLCSLPVVGLQACLLARRGQSIGKLAMHTRIVRSNGRHASFPHTVLLRWAPFWRLTETPAVLDLLDNHLGIEPA